MAEMRKEGNAEPLFIFYDSEAANGNIYQGDVIEIAAKCHPGIVAGSFESLINTKQPLGFFAVNECGITTEHLKGQNYLPGVMARFLDWIDIMVGKAKVMNRKSYYPVLCSHGGYHFDFLILFANLERVGVPPEDFIEHNVHFADTFVFCKELQDRHEPLLNEVRLSMDGLFKEFFPKESYKGRHRAMGDVEAMVKLFTKTHLKKMLHLMPITTFQERVKYFISQALNKQQQLLLEDKLCILDPCSRKLAAKRLLREGVTYDTLQTIFQECSSYMDFWQFLKNIGIERRVGRVFTSQFGAMGLQNQGSLGYHLAGKVRTSDNVSSSDDNKLIKDESTKFTNNSTSAPAASADAYSGSSSGEKAQNIVPNKVLNSRKSVEENRLVSPIAAAQRATSSSKAFEQRPANYAVTSSSRVRDSIELPDRTTVDSAPKAIPGTQFEEYQDNKLSKSTNGVEREALKKGLVKSEHTSTSAKPVSPSSVSQIAGHGGEDWDNDIKQSATRSNFVLTFTDVIPISVTVDDLVSQVYPEKPAVDNQTSKQQPDSQHPIRSKQLSAVKTSREGNESIEKSVTKHERQREREPQSSAPSVGRENKGSAFRTNGKHSKHIEMQPAVNRNENPTGHQARGSQDSRVGGATESESGSRDNKKVPKVTKRAERSVHPVASQIRHKNGKSGPVEPVSNSINRTRDIAADSMTKTASTINSSGYETYGKDATESSMESLNSGSTHRSEKGRRHYHKAVDPQPSFGSKSKEPDRENTNDMVSESNMEGVALANNAKNQKEKRQDTGARRKKSKKVRQIPQLDSAACVVFPEDLSRSKGVAKQGSIPNGNTNPDLHDSEKALRLRTVYIGDVAIFVPLEKGYGICNVDLDEEYVERDSAIVTQKEEQKIEKNSAEMDGAKMEDNAQANEKLDERVAPPSSSTTNAEVEGESQLRIDNNLQHTSLSSNLNHEDGILQEGELAGRTLLTKGKSDRPSAVQIVSQSEVPNPLVMDDTSCSEADTPQIVVEHPAYPASQEYSSGLLYSSSCETSDAGSGLNSRETPLPLDSPQNIQSTPTVINQESSNRDTVSEKEVSSGSPTAENFDIASQEQLEIPNSWQEAYSSSDVSNQQYFNGEATDCIPELQWNGYIEGSWPNIEMQNIERNFSYPTVFPLPTPQYPYPAPLSATLPTYGFYPAVPQMIPMLPTPPHAHYPPIPYPAPQGIMAYRGIHPGFRLPMPFFAPPVYQGVPEMSYPQQVQNHVIFNHNVLDPCPIDSPDVCGIPDSNSVPLHQNTYTLPNAIASFSDSSSFTSENHSERSSPFPYKEPEYHQEQQGYLTEKPRNIQDLSMSFQSGKMSSNIKQSNGKKAESVGQKKPNERSTLEVRYAARNERLHRLERKDRKQPQDAANRYGNEKKKSKTFSNASPPHQDRDEIVENQVMERYGNASVEDSQRGNDKMKSSSVSRHQEGSPKTTPNVSSSPKRELEDIKKDSQDHFSSSYCAESETLDTISSLPPSLRDTQDSVEGVPLEEASSRKSHTTSRKEVKLPPLPTRSVEAHKRSLESREKKSLSVSPKSNKSPKRDSEKSSEDLPRSSVSKSPRDGKSPQSSRQNSSESVKSFQKVPSPTSGSPRHSPSSPKSSENSSQAPSRQSTPLTSYERENKHENRNDMNLENDAAQTSAENSSIASRPQQSKMGSLTNVVKCTSVNSQRAFIEEPPKHQRQPRLKQSRRSQWTSVSTRSNVSSARPPSAESRNSGKKPCVVKEKTSSGNKEESGSKCDSPSKEPVSASHQCVEVEHMPNRSLESNQASNGTSSGESPTRHGEGASNDRDTSHQACSEQGNTTAEGEKTSGHLHRDSNSHTRILKTTDKFIRKSNVQDKDGLDVGGDMTVRDNNALSSRPSGRPMDYRRDRERNSRTVPRDGTERSNFPRKPYENNRFEYRAGTYRNQGQRNEPVSEANYDSGYRRRGGTHYDSNNNSNSSRSTSRTKFTDSKR